MIGATRPNNDAPRVTKKGKPMIGSLNMLGYGIATIGPAIAVGLIFAAYINGVARQPEAQGKLQPIAILGFALPDPRGTRHEVRCS